MMLMTILTSATMLPVLIVGSSTSFRFRVILFGGQCEGYDAVL
jgi:hypothetical protein